jgi:hypothetical protein
MTQEIIAAINYNKNLQQKNGGIPVAGINIMKRFDPERVHRYIVSCITYLSRLLTCNIWVLSCMLCGATIFSPIMPIIRLTQ